ncbi:MAG: valine--tRNA ligase [Ornithinimicrobium sp.]|uniref:valine--tRNA ligase n=1 Tax=Ornithinimicrobium sp. TaxID=1977084 RepID=UPI003D9B2909
MTDDVSFRPRLRPITLPDRPSVDGLEQVWSQVWADRGTYVFDRAAALSARREQLFVIDTPPPTASGSLHVGHVFSYTHTDALARYQRMAGRTVFYPMGWDDNGLPTERRVQNYYGVRGDASLPYDPGFEPPMRGSEDTSGKAVKAQDQQPVSRANFIELCDELTVLDEEKFEGLWRKLGLSVDWSLTYRTIDDRSRAVSQQAFLRNLVRGEAYQQQAPGLWDVTFQTAVAQAELEARDYPGAYHRVAYHRPTGDGAAYVPVYVETTRPELIPAAVALIAHPDDERYADLFGSAVTSPLFGVQIPVLAHPLAEMDKGAGIAMCCTFGDLTDVQWWRELDLPNRSVITRSGRMQHDIPDWLGDEDSAGAQLWAEQLAGKTTFSARAAMVEALRASGDLDGEPVATQRKANFFEKGDKPLEIVSTRQWYIRNGGKDTELRAALLERGTELDFHPSFMRTRYENWLGGLNGDCLISRQRFFGVPIPVWYALDDAGEPDLDMPLVPAEDTLPVDPSSQAPPGYVEDQRGRPGGFVGDPDVMDTWATSSLSPQIASGWPVGGRPDGELGNDRELFAATYPMDLRPQGQDIIRTWLFATVVRAHHEHGALPWAHAAVSGWILDPDRKKMSKSKGNAQTPEGMLDNHGSDGVRYWAASGRLGVDAAFDEGQMKVGRRLAIKALNASKFALSMGAAPDGTLPEPEPLDVLVTRITEPLDRAMIAGLSQVVATATAAYEAFDHTKALEVTETAFWTFCDDYLELVKERAYGSTVPAGSTTGAAGDGAATGWSAEPASESTRSARAALQVALDVYMRLLAPVLVFATEEVWSWWHTDSVHTQPWPTTEELAPAAGGDPRMLAVVGRALTGLRKAKSEAKVKMRTEISAATVAGPSEDLDLVQQAKADLTAAGKVTGALELHPAQEFRVHDVALVEPPVPVQA